MFEHFCSHIVDSSVFRELLQNSDDAGCDTVEIRFETAAFLGLDPEPGTNAAPPRPPNPKTTNVENDFPSHCYSTNTRSRSCNGHSKTMGNRSHRKIGIGYQRLVCTRPCFMLLWSHQLFRHSAWGNPDPQKVGAFGVGGC